MAHADPPALTRLLAPGAALLIISLLGLLVVGRLAAVRRADHAPSRAHPLTRRCEVAVGYLLAVQCACFACGRIRH